MNDGKMEYWNSVKLIPIFQPSNIPVFPQILQELENILLTNLNTNYGTH